MAASPTDPRLRPFRALAWAFYLFVSVGFSSLVIYSVTKSVFEMSPGRPPVSSTKPLGECVRELSAAFDELQRERASLGAVRAVGADHGWMLFRNRWLFRVRTLEASCDLEAAERQPLKETFAALDKVMDVATVHATQVSGQLGPSLDAFRAQLQRLEASPSK